MIGEPKRQNHPLTAYAIGLVVMLITGIVLVGTLYHLTLSPDGPQLLKPLVSLFSKQEPSLIMDEAKRQAETAMHKTRDQVKAELVEKAIEQAEKIIRQHFKPEDEERLVGEYMAQLAEASNRMS